MLLNANKFLKNLAGAMAAHKRMQKRFLRNIAGAMATHKRSAEINDK